MALTDLIQVVATLQVCFIENRGNKHPSNKTVCLYTAPVADTTKSPDLNIEFFIEHFLCLHSKNHLLSISTLIDFQNVSFSLSYQIIKKYDMLP